jgi:hypothetical protein
MVLSWLTAKHYIIIYFFSFLLGVVSLDYNGPTLIHTIIDLHKAV